MPKVEKTKKPVKAMKTARKVKRTIASRKQKTTKNLLGKPATGVTDQLVSLEVRNLTSDMLRDLTYSNGDLTVNFRDGGLYRYPKISPELVMQLLSAESYGRFFNQKIKGLPCERLA